MQNGLRIALNRAGAFAMAVLILIVFLFLSLRGTGAPVSIEWFLHIFGSHPHARAFTEPSLALILQGLPSTLELLACSLILASATAFTITVLYSRLPLRLRGVAENVSLPLRCIPFVLLAATIVALSAYTGYFGDQPPNQVARFFYPAACLALSQVAFFIGARSIGDFYRAFVKSLSEILGAAVVTEALFAWPGDGRLFIQAIWMGAPSVAVALLLVAAVAVLLMRIPVSDV